MNDSFKKKKYEDKKTIKQMDSVGSSLAHWSLPHGLFAHGGVLLVNATSSKILYLILLIFINGLLYASKLFIS